jgi:hypothetical protein
MTATSATRLTSASAAMPSRFGSQQGVSEMLSLTIRGSTRAGRAQNRTAAPTTRAQRHGTWTSKDGALCWSNDVRTNSGNKEPTTDRCWEARFGPGTDGGKKSKQALGLKMQKKPGYFWVWKDGQVYDKEFKTGDKISAAATKIEAKFPAQ